MQKIWQWFRDRKTNTLRKWRSTVVQKTSSDEEFHNNNNRVGREHFRCFFGNIFSTY